MKKLTKEQADWVIQQFHDTQRMKNTRTFGYLGIDNFDIDYIEKIIKQCTEKEFPEYRDCETGLYITDAGYFDAPYIRVGSSTEYVSLSVAEFIDYANNVARIKEWLTTV